MTRFSGARRPARNLVSLGLLALTCALTASTGAAQIVRHPTGVNVNAQGGTSVFLTFSNLSGYVPVEAIWCGALVSAAPSVGDRCDPGTIFGALPIRYAQQRSSGFDALTDIMSIPPSVARRAYQAADQGEDSRFFYVRRFVDPSGQGPDQFVTVTCRLTGGGARTPFSILDVRLRFVTEEPVLSVSAEAGPVPLAAEIAYNGTGRLVGRWEVVLPGDEPPTAFDLLTEGALPLELRGTQKRYLELERFNVFLPPTGKTTLPGPRLDRIPTDVPGLYQVLLRIEASDDKEGDSDLAAIGAGTGVVHSGAVAGFPIPALRYVVGSGGSVALAGVRLRTLFPAADSAIAVGESPTFSWSHTATLALYRLEVREADSERPLIAALLSAGVASYQAPPWLRERTDRARVEWRVVGLDAQGAEAQRTPWQSLKLTR